jgi:hypothetical protein
MLKRLKLAFKKTSIGPAFVIGTGRSGTHWLGYALENHPHVRATIEAQANVSAFSSDGIESTP